MNLKRMLMTLVLPLLCMAYAQAQDKVVTGKVTDSKDGSPLAAITVMVKGTKVATQTTAEGTFTIKVPASANTLVFSSVGYTQQEVAVGSSPLNVALVQSNNSLNEVVVIGYGTQ